MSIRKIKPRPCRLALAMLILLAGCPKNITPPPPKPSAPPAAARIEPGPDFEARVEAKAAEDDFAGAIALVADFIHQLPPGPERAKDAAYANELLVDLFIRARARAIAVDADAKPGAILVTRDCDPRLDPTRCPPSGPEGPFFDRIKQAGRKVEFRLPASFVEFFRYDLVIVDACSDLADRPYFEALQWYLFAGGRVLALCDAGCKDRPLAINRLLAPLGLTASPEPPAAPEMAVSSAHPLLAGVTRLRVGRAASLRASGREPLAPVLARGDGKVIMAETAYGLGRLVAWGNPDVVGDPLFAPVLANLIQTLPGQAKMNQLSPQDLEAKTGDAIAAGRYPEAIAAVADFMAAAAQADAAGEAQALGREQLAGIFRRVRDQARAGSPEVAPGSVLYLADCDPRRDANLCGEAGSLEEIKPFFAAFEAAGRPLFIGVPAEWQDLFLYDLIIVDACGSVAERDYYPDLHWYIFAGGKALILGDYYCKADGEPSALRANRLLAPIGLAFTPSDPRDLNLIPVTGTHPYLAGVRSIDAFRVTPLRLLDPKDKTALTLISRPDGQPLLVLHPHGLGQALAWGSTGIIAEPTFLPVMANLLSGRERP
jgi:hypothetical protein